MKFSQKPLVDARKAAFSRLVSRVLETLDEAVSMRRVEGKTMSEIADRIGCDRSSLSRALNGTTSNLTLRTISDILWATDFDPQDFRADPIEKISPNWEASPRSAVPIRPMLKVAESDNSERVRVFDFSRDVASYIPATNKFVLSGSMSTAL